MENLRWILLVAGIFFILAIYFVGRQRRRKHNSDLFDNKQDLPGFTARDWEDIDEGVGEVRVVARDSQADEFLDETYDNQRQPYEDIQVAVDIQAPERECHQESDLLASDDSVVLTDEVDEPLVEQPEIKNHDEKSHQQNSTSTDIIVLYILAKPSEVLSGGKINSVARANGFVFGDMNIYHRLDGDGQTLFSVANMLEPGNFDPDSMHEISTSGLIVFMQPSNLTQAVDDFDEMLRSAYHMSEMLGANLCNKNRQPFTQADAEHYRSLISEKENQ